MTTTARSQVSKRKLPPKSVSLTFAGDLHQMLATQTNAVTRLTFPTSKYRKDPLRFFRDILGVEPWSKQVELLEAIRDHYRVAVKSGHKVSKSHTAAGIALWFYCSFPDARVIMTSTTARQVDTILWRELRMMRARCGRCVDCKKEDPEGFTITVPCPHSAWIDGEIGELARTGLKSDDFREIVGFTAREAEAVAGVSGKHLLYILDEASGIKPEIYEAIEGNRAGGARVVMFSNPTRTSGEFFDAFKSKERFYSLHTISSEDTPNVVYGENDPRAIAGLASPAWVKEKEEEWGRDSPLFKVRVSGEFAELEDAKIFSIHKIAESEERWENTPGTGRLFIGLDPAGESESGDESVWCTRRGKKVISLTALRGLSPEAHLVHTLGMVTEMRRDDREVPVLVLDREGETGNKVYNIFSAFLYPLESPPFELIGMRASDAAHRTPIVYDRQRDELAANLLKWINDGGAIVEDVKLAAEMHALEWIEQEKSGKVKLTAKKDLRKLLKRSPDRYDALSLCVWEPVSVEDKLTPRREIKAGISKPRSMDPYAGSDGFGRH